MKIPNPTFFALLQSYEPYQTVHVCITKVTAEISGNAIIPFVTGQVDSEYPKVCLYILH